MRSRSVRLLMQKPVTADAPATVTVETAGGGNRRQRRAQLAQLRRDAREEAKLMAEDGRKGTDDDGNA